ncbi:unnamed protein product, partial [Discosporangium mesarthrocarpum]
LLLNVEETEAELAAARHMEEVLLLGNTVLEAFGNAKTVRNDNSSRFGKYIKLQYDQAYRLVGAKTEHFLLEKSRLVHLEANERSYHILYQMVKALPEEKKRELGLHMGAEAFSLISQGGCLTASDAVDDCKGFLEVCEALTGLDFSEQDKNSMWRLLAAILHSGEVCFEDVPEAPNGENSCRMNMPDSCKGGSGVTTAKLAELWGLGEEELLRGIARTTVGGGGGEARASIALNAVQARENLMALIKHVYRQLFAWITRKINLAHAGPPTKGAPSTPLPFTPSPTTLHTSRKGDQSWDRGVEEGPRTFIGILDIFGFEIVNTNSFEQLCINYANEVLQRQFNHHIFVLEQEEYALEGLDVAFIPFQDNQPIIDLIVGAPHGLMNILDDQVLTGRTSMMKDSITDKNLLELYHQEHHRRSKNKYYRKPRFEGPEFIVVHYAGEVTYCINGFLEKNNDTLHVDLRDLILSGNDAFLQTLMQGEKGGFNATANYQSELSPVNGGSGAGGWSTPIRYTSSGDGALSPVANSPISTTPTGRGGGTGRRIAAKSSVSRAFRRQLEDLVGQLSRTEQHYVKCIKPNNYKAPGGWSSHLVIQQLRYSGVLEVVRIRREAFPMRVTYQEFYRRFGNLISHGINPSLPPGTISDQLTVAGAEICAKAFGEEKEGSDYQLGKTKIFLRDDGLEWMRWALHRHYGALVTRVQAMLRGRSARKRVRRALEAVVKAQALSKGFLQRHRYKGLQKAALSVQSIWRMWAMRERLINQKKCATTIQAAWR